jgi:peptidoglycan L-alanyl-D-glutamate endopeptidase CwlK
MFYKKRNAERLTKLHPKVRAMTEQWLAKLETAKREVLITAGYRTKAEQDSLYALGRTKPGKIVTNAKGGQSLHNYAVAIDFCPVDIKGNCLWADTKKFKDYAAVAKIVGFESGLDWKNFPDPPHLQFCDGHNLAYFQKGGTL